MKQPPSSSAMQAVKGNAMKAMKAEAELRVSKFEFEAEQPILEAFGASSHDACEGLARYVPERSLQEVLQLLVFDLDSARHDTIGVARSRALANIGLVSTDLRV